MIILNALDSLIKNNEKTLWYDLACTQISSFLLALLMCFCLCDRSITYSFLSFVSCLLSSLSSLCSSCCWFTCLSFSSWWNSEQKLSPDLRENKETFHLLSLGTSRASRKLFAFIRTMLTYYNVPKGSNTTGNVG